MTDQPPTPPVSPEPAEQPAAPAAQPVAPAAQPPAPAAPPAYAAAPPAPAGPPVAQKTNVLAIISLVAAFFVSLAAIICGHIALSQIKKRGEGGKGLAIAGLVLGYLGLVAGIIASIVVFTIVIPQTAGVVTKATDCAKVESAGSAMMSSLSTAFGEASDSIETAQADTEKAITTFKSATAGVKNSDVTAAIAGVDAKLDAMNAEFATLAAAPADQRDPAAFQSAANDVDTAWGELTKTCTKLSK